VQTQALQEHVTEPKWKLCCQCQKVLENRQVFIAVQNDETDGAAVMKSGRALHDATGNVLSPRVAQRVTRKTNVDDEDNCRSRRWVNVLIRTHPYLWKPVCISRFNHFIFLHRSWQEIHTELAETTTVDVRTTEYRRMNDCEEESFQAVDVSPGSSTACLG